MNILQIITDTPELIDMIPDTGAMAQYINTHYKEPDNTIRIGIGTVLDTLGLVSGNQLLDAIKNTPDYRYAWQLLEQGNLDINSPLVEQVLSLLVQAEVILQSDKDKLLDVGMKPVNVSTSDIARLIWSDNGEVILNGVS